MADDTALRPGYQVPSTDTKDAPDTQPVTVVGNVSLGAGTIPVDDEGVRAAIAGVVASLAGLTVTLPDTLTVTVGNPPDLSGLATQTTVASLDGKTPDTSGVWDYRAGVGGATSVIPAGGKVLQITAIALGSAGSFTINGGNTITIPYDATDKASSDITFCPQGNLIAPTVVFSAGVDAWMIEFVT